MKAHELARQLLAGPNLEVVLTHYDLNEWGEIIDGDIRVMKAKEGDELVAICQTKHAEGREMATEG